MHANARLVESFYSAFQRRDAGTMGGWYASTATFHDPVFSLEGWRIRAMWRMLCEAATDLRLEFRDVRADDRNAAAHWEAWYTFTATGRRVHNVIEATFAIEGGLIVRHTDRFSFHRWAAQALGVKGALLGWSPPVRRVVRRQAADRLDAYIRSRGLSEATT